MEPFNIKITHLGKEVTLTILPEEDYFKIIYYGAIVGALKNQGSEWEIIPEEDITAGDLPLFSHQQSYKEDVEPLTLNLIEVNQISLAIEKELSKA